MARLSETKPSWWTHLKQSLETNLSLRLLALLIAVMLWFFVNAGQHEAQIPLQVPVEYTGLNPQMVIVNQRPDFVNLLVSGPRTLLSLLDAGRLAVRLNLRGISPGPAEYKITPDMFRIPRGTSIDRIWPSQITLDVDEMISREVPVRPTLEGQVASGMSVGQIEFKPPSVAVTGPRQALLHLDAIDTQPIDVQGASVDFTRYARLVSVGDLIKLSTDYVTATVHIQDVIQERDFRGIPLAVRDGDSKTLVYPRNVSVTVRGPERVLKGFNLDGSVYIDAHDLSPGWYDAPVLVDLPKGLEVVRQQPEKVRLRINLRKTGR